MKPLRQEVYVIYDSNYAVVGTVIDDRAEAVRQAESLGAHTVQRSIRWDYGKGEYDPGLEDEQLIWVDGDTDNISTAYEMLEHGVMAAYEMSQIGVLSGRLHLYVYGKEGPVPHFHFFTNDKSIDGCIRLDKPEYFSHGVHRGKLSRKHIEELVNFMLSEAEGQTIPNWQLAIILWNQNNPSYKIPVDSKMPDYTQLS